MHQFLAFEVEEIVVRVDEILRFEAIDPDERHMASRPGGQHAIPGNARCRVYTKTTGWFYTSLDYATVMERLLAAAEEML